MAEHLANIFGTEKDRVNCPFYFKIGACRHGDRCSRLHNRPTISPTLLVHNLYMNPVLNAPLGADGLPVPVDPEKVQDFFEDFYEDLFLELDKYGEVEHLCVCDNLADHLVGNVYAKFREEEAAAAALQGMQGRYYAGKPIQVEFSPVTDFRESTCRQYEEGTCKRGGYCNFMHVRPVSRDLRKQLFGRYKGGSGGSTRFHDGARAGGGGGGGGRFNDRYGDRGDRGGRYDDRRGRRDFDDYDRGRRGGRDSYRGGGAERDGSAERRARIAQWNQDTAPAAPAAPAAAPPQAYGTAPPMQPYPMAAAPPAYGGGGEGYPMQQPGMPQGGYGGYAPPPPMQQPPPPMPQQHYGGGGGGFGAGGSGANTVPLGNMRTFPPPQ